MLHEINEIIQPYITGLRMCVLRSCLFHTCHRSAEWAQLHMIAFNKFTLSRSFSRYLSPFLALSISISCYLHLSPSLLLLSLSLSFPPSPLRFFPIFQIPPDELHHLNFTDLLHLKYSLRYIHSKIIILITFSQKCKSDDPTCNIIVII